MSVKGDSDYRVNRGKQVRTRMMCTLDKDKPMALGLSFPFRGSQVLGKNWWGMTKIKMSAFSAATATSGMAT